MYTLNGLNAANVHTLASYEPNGSFGAVVVARPNGGVKEQVAGRYAQRLAEQGALETIQERLRQASAARAQVASGGVLAPFYARTLPAGSTR